MICKWICQNSLLVCLMSKLECKRDYICHQAPCAVLVLVFVNNLLVRLINVSHAKTWMLVCNFWRNQKICLTLWECWYVNFGETLEYYGTIKERMMPSWKGLLSMWLCISLLKNKISRHPGRIRKTRKSRKAFLVIKCKHVDNSHIWNIFLQHIYM